MWRSGANAHVMLRGVESSAAPQRVFHTPPLKAQGSLEAAAFVYSALPPTKVYPGSTGVLGYANISLH